ncbi:MAG: flagellar hook-basal body protein [Kyrpidia sp.]|nr:flagellar hook-basal body protein [Kyrpidia sp.]
MRVLWTGASGMNTAGRWVDALANDAANLNTTGYKSEDLAFTELLAVHYAPGVRVPAPDTPPGLPVGGGVRAAARVSDWRQGPLKETGRRLDAAWEGEGFFAVSGPEGIRYTRDGSFQVSVDARGQARLATADGHLVLDELGAPIDLTGVDLSTLSIRPDGRIIGSVAGTPTDIATLQRVVFDHPERLIKEGNNLFAAGTETPLTPADVPDPRRFGNLRQGCLEAANADLADVMTKLMEAERMYALGARVILTADQMMSMANNLRG